MFGEPGPPQRPPAPRGLRLLAIRGWGSTRPPAAAPHRAVQTRRLLARPCPALVPPFLEPLRRRSILPFPGDCIPCQPALAAKKSSLSSSLFRLKSPLCSVGDKPFSLVPTADHQSRAGDPGPSPFCLVLSPSPPRACTAPRCCLFSQPLNAGGCKWERNRENPAQPQATGVPGGRVGQTWLSSDVPPPLQGGSGALPVPTSGSRA